MAGQCSAPVRMVSAAHSGVTMGSPIGFSAALEIVFGEIRAAARRAPCLFISAMSAMAAIMFLEFVTPGTAGTKATLTLTLEKADTTTGTLVCTNMRLGTTRWSGQGSPYTQEANFQYDSGDTEVLNPWTATF